MNDLEEDQLLIRQYLLGKVSDEERERVEEQFITDTSYRERVLLTEDELVEDYVFGALPEHERERFRQHYLSMPRQRRKLGATMALKKYAEVSTNAHSPPVTKPRLEASWWRATLTFFSGRRRLVRLSFAALVVAALVGAGLLVRTWRGERPDAAYAELTRLNRPGSTAPASPEAAPPAVLSVSLTPLLFRGDGATQKVPLGADTELVVLRLELPADGYADYRALLQNNDGREIFTLNALQAGAEGGRRVLTLRVPVEFLSPGDYFLKLDGLNPDGRLEEVSGYSFSVTRQP